MYVVSQTFVSPDIFYYRRFLMKLHDNQLRLIRHLIRFNILDYENCLKVLSTQDEKDEIALSYAFRPLTKNNYIAKNKDNIVTVLNKGKIYFRTRNS